MKQELIDMLCRRSFQYRQQPVFKLVSGRMSRFYVNFKPTTLSPRGMYLVGHLLFERLQGTGVTAVGGLTFGADPVAFAAAFVSELRQAPIKAFSIRLVISLALVVLAGVVLLTTLQLRHRIREQIAGRDGEVLHAVAMMHYGQDVADGLAGPISAPGGQLGVVLKTAQLRGVLGVRVFDTQGRFVDGFPFDVTEQQLDPTQLAALHRLEHVTRFHHNVRVDDLFLYPVQPDQTSGTIPLLEVIVPLHTEATPLAGIAQFLLDASVRLLAQVAKPGSFACLESLGRLSIGSLESLRRLWIGPRTKRRSGHPGEYEESP